MTLSAPARTLRVALVGNPNVGKTSLFNALTGLSARVGNYAGVTVEKKRGMLRLEGLAVEVVDLPGIYALSPHAPDEAVAFSVLAGRVYDTALDGVVVVLDASNLERNLYLYSQLLNLAVPLVVALTMEDVASRQAIQLDLPRLSERLGVPVIKVNAAKRTGIDALKAAIQTLVTQAAPPQVAPPVLSSALRREVEALAAWTAFQGSEWPGFLVERALIDHEGQIEQEFSTAFGPAGRTALFAARERAGGKPSLAAEEARTRYEWVHARLADGVLKRPDQRVHTLTDSIDAVLTHRLFGLLLFAVVMALLFQAVFAWSAPMQDLVDHSFKALGSWVGSHMAPGPLRSLIVDGIIAGFGTVLTFLPQIAVLFILLGLLEDCGYMARAAFLMDKVMSKAGLSGKSFIPMLSGFACAVPSIMATRTIENRRDRLATILALPLMSCSARLPVYTLLIGAFVPASSVGGLSLRGLALFAFYMLGVVVAIPLIWVLKRTVLRGDTPTLVMELPTYKSPSFRVVMLRVWQQVRAFLERAGTTIVLVAIVIWALAYFPHSQALQNVYQQQRAAVQASAPDAASQLAKLDNQEAEALIEDSYLARFGKALGPIFTPLGWDWRVTTGVLASFPARETVVATLGTLYSLGNDVDIDHVDSLREAMVQSRRPDGSPSITVAVAFSVMVFFALCLQCASTLVVMWRETGSWRWPAFAFWAQSGLAYVGAFLTYQVLRAVGL